MDRVEVELTDVDLEVLVEAELLRVSEPLPAKARSGYRGEATDCAMHSAVLKRLPVGLMRCASDSGIVNVQIKLKW